MSHAIQDYILVQKNIELINRFERLKELRLYTPRSKNLVYDGYEFKPSRELKALWAEIKEWRENRKRNTGKEIDKNGIRTIWMRIPKE